MATSFSNNQLNQSRKKFYGQLYIIKDNLNFLDKLINKILIFLYLFKYSLINIKRTIFRLLYIPFKLKPDNKIMNITINLDKNSIQKTSNDLRQNNFAFVENFLSTESHKYLLNNWPNINYFKHVKKIIKHYNIAFAYSPKQPINKTFGKFNHSYELRKFYELLLSNEFKKFYSNLVNFENENYELWAINSTMAPNDSYLVPHIDGINKNREIKQPYNFIYFLDGYEENPSLGGATGIYKDNEFKLPILIPSTIRNSLLIYNQSENFYHGFKTIECPKGICRNTISFQIKPKLI